VFLVRSGPLLLATPPQPHTNTSAPCVVLRGGFGPRVASNVILTGSPRGGRTPPPCWSWFLVVQLIFWTCCTGEGPHDHGRIALGTAPRPPYFGCVAHGDPPTLFPYHLTPTSILQRLGRVGAYLPTNKTLPFTALLGAHAQEV